MELAPAMKHSACISTTKRSEVRQAVGWGGEVVVGR